MSACECSPVRGWVNFPAGRVHFVNTGLAGQKNFVRSMGKLCKRVEPELGPVKSVRVKRVQRHIRMTELDFSFV